MTTTPSQPVAERMGLHCPLHGTVEASHRCRNYDGPDSRHQVQPSPPLPETKAPKRELFHPCARLICDECGSWTHPNCAGQVVMDGVIAAVCICVCHEVKARRADLAGDAERVATQAKLDALIEVNRIATLTIFDDRIPERWHAAKMFLEQLNAARELLEKTS